jgi:hypothetical protein
MMIRGVMLDMARTTQRKDYYRNLLPYLARWGYNTVFLHFTDDEGCALKFRSHPEVSAPFSFSIKEMKDFIRRAKRYNLELIPEIESLGHTKYITSLKKYKHLGEKQAGSDFNAICPTRGESKIIISDLIKETVELFPSKYIHAGLDETSFGACPSCRKALKTKKHWEIFADYICWLNSLITSNGKKMIMWGDYLISSPKITDKIPKDITICDWEYYASVNGKSTRFLINKGFKVIVCPALVSWREKTIIHPNTGNLTNIRRFASIAYKCSKRGVIGIVNTIWTPFKYIPGSIIYGMIFGGQVFNNNGKENKRVSGKKIKDYYGTKTIVPTLYNLHKSTLIKPLFQKIMHKPGRKTAKISKKDRKTLKNLIKRNTGILDMLRKNGKNVTKNKKDFEDEILSAETNIIICNIGMGVSCKGDILKKLYSRLTKSWSRTRYPVDYKIKSTRNYNPEHLYAKIYHNL